MKCKGNNLCSSKRTLLNNYCCSCKPENDLLSHYIFRSGLDINLERDNLSNRIVDKDLDTILANPDNIRMIMSKEEVGSDVDVLSESLNFNGNNLVNQEFTKPNNLREGNADIKPHKLFLDLSPDSLDNDCHNNSNIISSNYIYNSTNDSSNNNNDNSNINNIYNGNSNSVYNSNNNIYNGNNNSAYNRGGNGCSNNSSSNINNNSSKNNSNNNSSNNIYNDPDNSNDTNNLDNNYIGVSKYDSNFTMCSSFFGLSDKTITSVKANKFNFQVSGLYDESLKMLKEGRHLDHPINNGFQYNNITNNRLYTRRDVVREISESKISCVHSESKCITLIKQSAKGIIPRVKRRLNDKEKAMIGPGSIYVYKENESGIRRWTDKLDWTPSRICGPFLVYKNLSGILYKKTFSHVYCNEIYHVVIYSTQDDEKTRNCCLRI